MTRESVLGTLPQTIRAREAAERTNMVLADTHFTDACAAAGIKPTRRQARKWLRGRGLARQQEERGG